MADQEKDPKDGILATAAKAIGKAAGTIAHVAGVQSETPSPEAKKSAKPAKLEKKNKHRLPRKLKKEQKKEATAIKEELVGKAS